MRSTLIKGQRTSCRGELRVFLSGPKGSGKSLLAKVLKGLGPLLGVDVVRIITSETVEVAPPTDYDGDRRREVQVGGPGSRRRG